MKNRQDGLDSAAPAREALPSPRALTASRRALLTQGRAAARFPLRVGCADMGSNATRLLVAEFVGPGQVNPLWAERVPLRLGHDVFLTGRLPPRQLDEAVALLARFRARLRQLGVRHYRAVATSAVRESANGDALVERAHREARVELEVINGAEEARLVHAAVASRIPLGSQRWLLVDLGGGSVEVMLADGAGIHWTESHTMGAVRLLEELAGSAVKSGGFGRLLEEYTATLRIPRVEGAPPAGVIGTGGNIESLAALAGVPAREGVRVLPLRTLRALIRNLARLSYRQRVEELGLREDRADVILPAAAVFERLAVLAGARRIHVPGVGLKDGIVSDLVEALTAGQARDEREEARVREGAVALGRRYAFDEAHGVQVSELAKALFDALRELHGLGARERRALVAGALLHDIGTYVAHESHHEHSAYLIAASEIPGLGEEDLRWVAAIARHHRQAPDGTRSMGRGPVPALAALLRIADALDREHRQSVREVRAARQGRTVTLRIRGDGDLMLERWALRRKGALFEEVFGVELVARVERP